jgi:hypothetical protein
MRRRWETAWSWLVERGFVVVYSALATVALVLLVVGMIIAATGFWVAERLDRWESQWWNDGD